MIRTYNAVSKTHITLAIHKAIPKLFQIIPNNQEGKGQFSTVYVGHGNKNYEIYYNKIHKIQHDLKYKCVNIHVHTTANTQGELCDTLFKYTTKYHQIYISRYTRRAFIGSEIVYYSDVAGTSPAYMSALLQLHLHSWLQTWLPWIAQRNCKTRRGETFTFWVLLRLISEFWRHL